MNSKQFFLFFSYFLKGLESSFPDIEIAEIVEQSSININNSKIKTIDSMNQKFKPILDTKLAEQTKPEGRYSPMIKKQASPKLTANKVKKN